MDAGNVLHRTNGQLVPQQRLYPGCHMFSDPCAWMTKGDFFCELCSTFHAPEPVAMKAQFLGNPYPYLNQMNCPRERTYVVGSPMAEVLKESYDKILASDVHARLGLEKGKYILLSAHREENIDTEKNFLSLFNAVNQMAEKYDMPILYSCHPRSRKRLESSGFQLDRRVIQNQPLGFFDYNCLQMNAFAVVSDSGTLPEEASFFTSVGKPFPAVSIRTSTERPEALDKGCFVIAGIDGNGLVQAVDTAVSMTQNGDIGLTVPDYQDENVATKVVKLIQSYTGIVNKMVWRKF